MTSPVITVGLRTPVQEIATTLLENRISAVPVVGENGEVVGISRPTAGRRRT
jgi:CBS domain-containing protein